MFIVFVIIGLVIAIIVLLIKYFISYARLASYKTYDKAAKKDMKNRKIKDQRITCDYCGAVINIDHDKLCPKCGADFSKDDEWLKRHNNIDEKWVENKSNATADEQINSARYDARKIIKTICVLAIILVLLIAFIVVIALGEKASVFDNDFAHNEELNDKSFYHFMPVDYSINGDGVILDSDNFIITLKGIYQDEHDPTDYKFEYEIANNSSKNARIRVRLVSANDYAGQINFIYEKVRAGDTVTIYEQGYNLELDAINSLVYTDMSIVDTDYNDIYNQKGSVTITTNAKIAPPVKKPEGEVAFENEIITIYNLGGEEGRDEYNLAVENKSDYNFRIRCNGCKYDEKSFTLYGISGELIPAHCIYPKTRVYPHLEDLGLETSPDRLTIGFTFECLEHPEAGFSTEYFEIWR